MFNKKTIVLFDTLFGPEDKPPQQTEAETDPLSNSDGEAKVVSSWYSVNSWFVDKIDLLLTRIKRLRWDALTRKL